MESVGGSLSTMALVSVIIPVFNGERYIEEALDSVFAQTFRDIEVIVVNDGSTDGTEQRIQRYRGRITYHVQPNRGLSASRVEGLRLASGSLIAFLDADDVWLPGKLERQVKVACAHPEYGIITTDAEKFDESGVTLPSLKCWYQPTSGYVMEGLLSENWIPPSAALVRRECFELVRTFDVPPPNYGEDWMMWVQIAARYQVYFIDEVLVRSRQHAASMTDRGGEIQFQGLLRNLEIMKVRVSELKVQPDLVRQAGFRICIHRARADLKALDVARARDKLRLALGYKPHALSAWGLLTAAYLPSSFLQGVKRAVKWFHGPRRARHAGQC
jgi:hypothetical protein